FGIHPFDADEFNRWAQGPVSHGERVTARFLLAVWDPVIEWEAGKFDLMEALRIWDPPHREAFLAWASDPWWPSRGATDGLQDRQATHHPTQRRNPRLGQREARTGGAALLAVRCKLRGSVATPRLR